MKNLNATQKAAELAAKEITERFFCRSTQEDIRKVAAIIYKHFREQKEI